jgi:hypothetical protein
MQELRVGLDLDHSAVTSPPHNLTMFCFNLHHPTLASLLRHYHHLCTLRHLLRIPSSA